MSYGVRFQRYGEQMHTGDTTTVTTVFHYSVSDVAPLCRYLALEYKDSYISLPTAYSCQGGCSTRLLHIYISGSLYLGRCHRPVVRAGHLAEELAERHGEGLVHVGQRMSDSENFTMNI